jgi:hypothetical protein
MPITTKLARHYNNCCEQVMPVPVVMKQLMVDRRPVPCPPPDPPHPLPLPNPPPQPPPQPYQYQQPPPQPYQYQQLNSLLQPPPQPPPQPYQQSNPQHYQYQQPNQPIPPNPQPYQPYQPNPQPYSFNQHQPNPYNPYNQSYQHQLPYQQPYQLTQHGEPTVEKNNYQMVLYQPKESTVEINSLEAPISDIHYRVPPSYPIIEYSNDINALPGQIVIQTTERIPDGYLLCDGSDASREVDSHLFNAIGTFYGSGDGTTTFCLPDLEDEDQSHHYMIKR